MKRLAAAALLLALGWLAVQLLSKEAHPPRQELVPPAPGRAASVDEADESRPPAELAPVPELVREPAPNTSPAEQAEPPVARETPPRLEPADPAPEEPAPVEGPTGLVVGRVVDRDGAPLTDAIVKFDPIVAGRTNQLGSWVQAGRTGFEKALEPGEYEVTVSLTKSSQNKHLGRPPRRTVQVVESGVHHLREVVVGGRRLVDPGGAVPTSIPVYLQDLETGAEYVTLSDPWGKFGFEWLYPGSYELAVAPDGAIEGNPRSFLTEPGPRERIQVVGDENTRDLGDYTIHFDGSYHLFCRLRFEGARVPESDNLRARVWQPKAFEQRSWPLALERLSEFEWHVRDPTGYGECELEVYEVEPDSDRAVWTRAVPILPRANQREFVTLVVDL